jgi:hypothetical protein
MIIGCQKGQLPVVPQELEQDLIQRIPELRLRLGKPAETRCPLIGATADTREPLLFIERVKRRGSAVLTLENVSANENRVVIEIGD